MYKAQSIMNEKHVAFSYPEKVFPSPRQKQTIVFEYIFSLGKGNQKIQCDNIVWHGCYLPSKDQENTSAGVIDNMNLKYIPYLTIQPSKPKVIEK